MVLELAPVAVLLAALLADVPSNCAKVESPFSVDADFVDFPLAASVCSKKLLERWLIGDVLMPIWKCI
jgi:hypothetical protein